MNLLFTLISRTVTSYTVMTSKSAMLVPQPIWVPVDIEFVPSFLPSGSWKEDLEFPKQRDALKSDSEAIFREPLKQHESPGMLRQSLSQRSEENLTPAEGFVAPPAENPSPSVPTYVQVDNEFIHKRNCKNLGTKKAKSNGLRDVSRATAEQHECFCRICARGGPFIKCHTCTAVYHKTCMYEAAWQRTAKGTWRCPNCLYMHGKDALRPDNRSGNSLSAGGTTRKPSGYA